MKYKRQREKNKSKKLLLLGTAISSFEPDYENNDFEIWGVGSAFGKAHEDIKRVDLGFEIHPIEQIAKIANERQVDYNKFKCPMMVQNANHPLTKQMMKNPKTFPLDDVLAYQEEIGAARLACSTCFSMERPSWRRHAWRRGCSWAWGSVTGWDSSFPTCAACAPPSPGRRAG